MITLLKIGELKKFFRFYLSLFRACAKNIKLDILIFSIFIFPLYFNHFCMPVFISLCFTIFFAQALQKGD